MANQLIELLERSELFGTLDTSQRSSLAGQMNEIVLDPGQSLFERGEKARNVYVVQDGRIRISVLSPDGRELSFAHATRGDLFGEIAALDGGPRSAAATAITRSRLGVLPPKALHRLLANDSKAALEIIKLLCRRLRELSDHYEAIVFHPVEVRLSQLLLDRLRGEPPSLDSHLALEMSQTDLALLIGTTRQRANAALAFLERAGAIERSGSTLKCHFAALTKLAQRDF